MKHQVKRHESADTELQSQRARRHQSTVARFVRLGYVGLGLFCGTIGVWSATASMSGAVVAPGMFVVESNLKRVQHPQGGVAAEVLVREGQSVREGDLLVRLDDTIARTTLQIHTKQIDELLARVARLEAERDGEARLTFHPSLTARMADPELRVAVAGEARLFEARANARKGQRAQLESRIAQLSHEIDGLTQQLDARRREREMIQRELEGVRSLFKRNLVQINRLSMLEREASTIEGHVGQNTAQIALAHGKIAETRLQLVQIAEDLRVEVMRELREGQSRLAELQERRVAAEDLFNRIEVRAPATGRVHQLSVHGRGAVVSAAEPLMQIVPSDDELTLEARVSPSDYDQLHLGQDAVVRLHAFNQRTTPELFGTVSRLAADLTRDPVTGERHYLVRISIAAGERQRLAPLQFTPGMHADTFIKTGERSPLSFLLKPVSDQFARALRER
jgi:HlyD family secretion protein